MKYWIAVSKVTLDIGVINEATMFILPIDLESVFQCFIKGTGWVFEIFPKRGGLDFFTKKGGVLEIWGV